MTRKEDAMTASTRTRLARTLNDIGEGTGVAGLILLLLAVPLAGAGEMAWAYAAGFAALRGGVIGFVIALASAFATPGHKGRR